MNVLVTATHKVLPKINKVVDTNELPDLMGKLIHFGYEIVDEIALSLLERGETLPGYHFDYLDETPWMCSDCCEVTPKHSLTETERCPACASHKLIEVV